MKKFDNIILSENAPHPNSIWLHDGVMQYHSNGKWNTISGNKKQTSIGSSTQYQPYITDILFTIGGDNSSAREKFTAYSYDYLHDHIPVLVDNGPNQYTFGCLGMYHNGQITVVTDGKLVLYNVDYNDDTWPVSKIKTIDLTLLPTYVDLEIGSSEEVASYNLEQLLKVSGTQFLVHADYGIGVGTWHPIGGGKATITTAGGDRVHYFIGPEGECYKDNDHFDHSNLFYDMGNIYIGDFDTDDKLTKTLIDPISTAEFKRASSISIRFLTDTEVFNIICPLDSISIERRLFLSPKIYADGENETTLRIAANLLEDKIIIEITKTTV